MVKARVSAAGALMFILQDIERNVQKMSRRISNDNAGEQNPA